MDRFEIIYFLFLHIYIFFFFSRGEVSILDIQADGSVRMAEPKIPLSHLGDNVRVISETGAVLVAGPASGWSFLSGFRNNFTYTPFGVKKTTKVKNQKLKTTDTNDGISSSVTLITNATKQFYGGKYATDLLYRDAEGKRLYGASVAAAYWPERIVLIGGPTMQGVYQCEWPPKTSSSPSNNDAQRKKK